MSGHTPGSIGIITPDNILYSGDALFGLATLSKHPVLFYTDIQQTLITLKKLAMLLVNACVLYHGGMIEDVAGIVSQHEQKILETKDVVFNMIQNNLISLDSLTQQVMQNTIFLEMLYRLL